MVCSSDSVTGATATAAPGLPRRRCHVVHPEPGSAAPATPAVHRVNAQVCPRFRRAGAGMIRRHVARLVAVERSEAAETRTRGDRRSLFERFVQAAYRRVSQAPFFFLCTGIVVAWLVSLPLWADLKEWQTAIHTVASVLTLLLVVLLENASRRAEEASQEKLNVIAEALAELMASEARHDLDLRDAAKRLREAVGLEERH